MKKKELIQLAVATCNANCSNLQSWHLQTSINCNQPAIIGLSQDYLQLTESTVKRQARQLVQKTL